MIRALLLAAAVALPSAVFGQAASSSLSPAVPSRQPQAAPAAGSSGLVGVQGSVEVKSENGSVADDVTAPWPLETGDEVRVRDGGRATVRMRDGSEVVLGAGSVLVIEEESPLAVSIRLTAGKLWAYVSKLRRRKFQVRTPTAVASVRGTTFAVEAMSRRAAVEVFEGRVGVMGKEGVESLLNANQKIEVLDGRMGRVEKLDPRQELPRPFVNRREDGKKDEKGGRPEKKDERRGERPREERGARVDPFRDRMRQEVEREVGMQLARNQLETNAAFDGKNSVYQEGRSLIDAFGKRVRVEQYLTRPAPESFKVTTLNLRESRLDKSTLEITANQALPRNIADAGNLFFHAGGAPQFWATRMRWDLSSGPDRYTHLSVDGKPAQVDILSGVPACMGPNCQFGANATGGLWQTIFGHRYEFLVSGPSASYGVIENIWNTSNSGGGGFRPADDAAMMWHSQPTKIVLTDLVTTQTYVMWVDAFRTVSGTTGKAFFDRSFTPLPGFAHSVDLRNYIGFTDTTGRGILNFGDMGSIPGAPWGIANNVSMVYTRLWDGSATPGTGGTTFTPVTFSNQTVFSPVNGIAAGSAGNPNLSVGGFGDPNISNFLNTNPTPDWMVSQNFVINDFGQIHQFAGGTAAQGNQAEVNQAYESFNFERAVASSRFGGRKIDVVFDPRLYVESGLLKTKHGGQGRIGD